MKCVTRGVLSAALLVAAAAPARAQFTTFYGVTPGFVANSATGAYLAAIGGASQYHLDFNTDALGNTVAGSGQISGTTFSPLVTFSTTQSANGGTTSSLVNYSGAGPSSEIGPQPLWGGILNINFMVNGMFASAVGFGGVDMSGGAIRLYDQNNNLIRTDVATSDLFGFYGYVASGDQRIGRIELDEGFYAIQDLSFNAAAVTATPEPATIALMVPGLLGLAGVRRLRRRSGESA